MPYHPLFGGLWRHEDLEGCPFEEKAFFAFLWSNDRIRPSGIYRATDAQLAADAELPVKTVTRYILDLASRRRIVRDGAWMFVRGYLARQPKQERLLLGVQSDVASCSSVLVLESFSEKYPMFSKWSADRLEKVNNPHNDYGLTEQLQSSNRAEQRTVTRPSAHMCIEILDFLNRKAGRAYRPSESNLALIRGRLADGIEPWQLKAIVSRKVREWAGDPKMAKYLRPATLFNATKCEQYVGELPAHQEVPDGDQ